MNTKEDTEHHEKESSTSIIELKEKYENEIHQKNISTTESENSQWKVALPNQFRGNKTMTSSCQARKSANFKAKQVKQDINTQTKILLASKYKSDINSEVFNNLYLQAVNRRII